MHNACVQELKQYRILRHRPFLCMYTMYMHVCEMWPETPTRQMPSTVSFEFRTRQNCGKTKNVKWPLFCFLLEDFFLKKLIKLRKHQHLFTY